MQKMLFISPELPYPLQSGGKVKTFKLLQHFARHYAVTFASPLKGDDAGQLAAFHAVSPCAGHLHEPLSVPRSAGNLLLSYLQGRPLNVRRTLSAPLRQRLGDIASDYDVVFLDHYEVYPYLPRAFGGLVVYHAHNAYFKLWQRFAAQPGNPALRAAAWLESRRVRRYECRVARAADLVFAAPNDALELYRSGVPADRLRDTYHLGDDSQLDLPDLRFEDTAKKLVYVGFLGWEPNVQGLLWFIDSVWPTLRALHPDLQFDIVGKNPDERLLRAVRGRDGIRLRGFVEDLETVYRSSRVSVAPLLFGSGMKVKVLDALARGIPTATTRVGAEGIAAEHGHQLMVADCPDRFADSVHRLLTDPALWRTLQGASRALVRERYTWARLFADMQHELDAAQARHVERSGTAMTGIIGNAG